MLIDNDELCVVLQLVKQDSSTDPLRASFHFHQCTAFDLEVFLSLSIPLLFVINQWVVGSCSPNLGDENKSDKSKAAGYELSNFGWINLRCFSGFSQLLLGLIERISR